VLRRLRLPSTQLFYAGVASGLALFFAVGYPAQLRIHPLLMNADTSAPMRKVDNISESAWHRHHPELRYSAVRKLQDADLLTRYEQASERQLNQTNVAIGGFCAALFFAFDSFVIHSWGLTQPILARADVPTDRPGHKYGLRPLAQDLAAVYRAEPRGRGMFQRAVADGKAPSFVRENLTRIRVLERKMYNQHAFGENLKLALARPGPIVVPKTPGH
jgi:hypothetical protein